MYCANSDAQIIQSLNMKKGASIPQIQFATHLAIELIVGCLDTPTMRTPLS
jgi:hypothetical protein